ncbi:MAG: hypothetical protein AAGI23_15165 [Bacteroidota bacterium]
MKRVLLSLSMILSLSLPIYAQHNHNHDHTAADHEPHYATQAGTQPAAHFSCGWGGEPVINMKSFNSNAEAEAVMNDILSVIGLRANYSIQAAKVPNAAAVVYGDKRYIYYNPRFMTNVTESTNTNWGSISIVAHEIGHHLNGHTLKAGGSQRHMEIEADEFSGFVLRKMGATLAEAQIAMRKLAGDRGTSTHPGKTERLMAIEKGWRSADQQITGYSRQMKVPSNSGSNNNSSNTRANNTTASNSSSGSTATTATTAPAFAAYRVTLRSNPGKAYYITTRYNFVALRGDKVKILGKLVESSNDRYPYKIDFDNEQIADLLISRKGELYSMKGSIVGSLARISRQPAPQGHSFLGVDLP